MEKKVTIFIIIAIVLALGLWGGSRYFEYQKENTKTPITIEGWNGETPNFRGEDITSLYLVYPQNRTIYRVLEQEFANQIFEELNRHPVKNVPDMNTDLGFLLTTEEATYSLYITDGPEVEKGRVVRELAETIRQKSPPYVDVYLLIPPVQIQRLRFEGVNMDADGNKASRRVITLDTTNPEAIAQANKALRAMTILSMELVEEGKEVNLESMASQDGYSLILDLNESYKNQQIRVAGSRYQFRIDLDFQKNQRVYTCDYLPIKKLLDQIERMSETVTSSFIEQSTINIADLLASQPTSQETSSQEEIPESSEGSVIEQPEMIVDESLEENNTSTEEDITFGEEIPFPMEGEESSSETETSLSPPTGNLPPLPKEDFIPLPEGLQLLQDKTA